MPTPPPVQTLDELEYCYFNAFVSDAAAAAAAGRAHDGQPCAEIVK